MKIKGELGVYDVTWRQCGFGYAEAVVRIRVPFLRYFSRRKTLWTSSTTANGSTMIYYDASRMGPDQLQSWFRCVVKEFERYKKAWDAGLTNPD